MSTEPWGIYPEPTYRRTGVIVGVSQDVTLEMASEVCSYLQDRFPGVTFALATHATSVAFEWYGPKAES